MPSVILATAMIIKISCRIDGSLADIYLITSITVKPNAIKYLLGYLSTQTVETRLIAGLMLFQEIAYCLL